MSAVLAAWGDGVSICETRSYAWVRVENWVWGAKCGGLARWSKRVRFARDHGAEAGGGAAEVDGAAAEVDGLAGGVVGRELGHELGRERGGRLRSQGGCWMKARWVTECQAIARGRVKCDRCYLGCACSWQTVLWFAFCGSAMLGFKMRQ